MRTQRKIQLAPAVSMRSFFRITHSSAAALKPIHAGRLNNINVAIFDNPSLPDDPQPAALAAANDDIDRLFAGLRASKATLSIMAWGDTMIPAWHQRAKRISDQLQEHPEFFTEIFGGAYFAQGDEFVGIDNNHPHSAVPYFRRHFLDRIITSEPAHSDILRENNFFFINGKGEELSERERFYSWVKDLARRRNPGSRVSTTQEMLRLSDPRIEATLGVGPDCHVLFCEKLNKHFLHLPFGQVALSATTRHRKDASYDSDFSHALTLRGEIFWPERVNFIVTRANKVDEVFESFGVPHTKEKQNSDFCPAREFQTHPNVHLYCSLAAGQRLIPFLQTGD